MEKKIYVTTSGSGDQVIVWLHGLWGGGNYYRHLDITAHLPQELTHVFPDELGFGKSTKPDIEYTPLVHAKALADILPRDKKVILIGFSFGALLAVNFAKFYPDRIKSLILISPPIYKNTKEAKKYLSTKWLTRLTIESPFLTKLICKAFCKTRILSLAAPLFAEREMKKTSIGVTQHTWQSYWSSFNNVLLYSSVFGDLDKVVKKINTLIIYGDLDNYLPFDNLQELRSGKLRIVKISGAGHDLFRAHLGKCLEAIGKFIS
jgi:pimeloyl-ACP methyl ester carboxylesterase